MTNTFKENKPSLSHCAADETPKISHFNSPNAIHLPTLDELDNKRSFQYKKGPLIAKGCYGDVFECLNLNSGELLAVKSIKVEQ